MTLGMRLKRQSVGLFAGVLALSLTACGGGGDTANTDAEQGNAGADTTEATTDAPAEAGSEAEGNVMIDGSSTVFPISEAMAEEFMAANKGVQVTVGVSGTGGGFKKFCAGETDMANASRPIKQEEIDLCKQNGIEYVELPVAFDGLSVVVNKENDWATCLKPDELGAMWKPDAEGKVMKWNQVRPDFPDQALALFGPGTDSGTYDYFTDATTGEEGESRGDYTASEDDNVIVQGVESDKGSLGFFGFAYYEENKDQLKLIEVENSDGKCVTPNPTTIADGSYNPLSRPLFVYVSTKALEAKPEVQKFVDFHFDDANQGLIAEVGYVALPAEILEKVKARVAAKTTGTIFEGGSSVGVKLSEKL